MSKKTTAINGGCPQFQLLMIYDNKKNNLKIRCFTTAFYLANNGDITPRYPSVDLDYPPKQTDNFYTHRLM